MLECLIWLSCMCCLMVFCALTFTPPSVKSRPSSVASNTSAESSSLLERFIYVANWRNPKFVIWAVVLPLALFGYFVPFVHLVQFAESMPLDTDPGTNNTKASFLLACISTTSGI